MTTTIQQVPLNQLMPGDKAKGGSIDSRKTDDPIAGLTASLREHGLLVPLLVRKGDGGKFYAIDGNRRLRALQAIHKSSSTIEIPCIEPKDGNPLELSMVANVERAELHPVDRFEVYAALVEGGETVDNIGKRYGLTVKHVRQALALGRMAPAVRDAWRAGTISAETAEAFVITTDHKAQAAALKKIGKHGSAWNVRQLLSGGTNLSNFGNLLKYVGRAEYEKAGHQINATLFQRGGQDDDANSETVSDVAALRRMAADKMQGDCEKLVEDGWKWAISEDGAPRDWRAWRVVRTDTEKYTKEQMSELGCVVGLDYDGRVTTLRGIVKPGDKVALPKSPKAKKAEAKKREQRKVETGGISNQLAMRLSKALTAAMREAMVGGIGNDDAQALTIAALASVNEAMPFMRLGGQEEDGNRQDNDFARYLTLAQSRHLTDRCKLLMTWLATAVDLTCHDGAHLGSLLHPGKGDRRDVRLIAELIDQKALLTAARKQFDAKDYFGSIPKALIVEAVSDALGKERADRVAKMKTGEAAKYAIAHVPKTGWIPEQLRM